MADTKKETIGQEPSTQAGCRFARLHSGGVRQQVPSRLRHLENRRL